jgi:hypothetical protein
MFRSYRTLVSSAPSCHRKVRLSLRPTLAGTRPALLPPIARQIPPGPSSATPCAHQDTQVSPQSLSHQTLAHSFRHTGWCTLPPDPPLVALRSHRHLQLAAIPFKMNIYKTDTKQSTLTIFRMSTYAKTPGGWQSKTSGFSAVALSDRLYASSKSATHPQGECA